MEELSEQEAEQQLNAIAKEEELRLGSQIVGAPVPELYEDEVFEADLALLRTVSNMVYSGRVNEAEAEVESVVESRSGQQTMLSLSAMGLVAFFRFNFVSVSAENELSCSQVLERLESTAKGVLATWDSSGSKSLLSSLFSSSSGAAAAATTTDGPTAAQQTRLCLEADVVLSFAPLCYAVFALRSGTKTGLLRGAYNLRKAYQAFSAADARAQKLASSDRLLAPLMAMIQFGLGIFHFSVSMVPPTLQWFVKLIGFSGDREQAVHELERAGQEPRSPFRTEARLALMALRQFYLDDEAGCDALLVELKAELPSSPMLLTAEAGIERLRGRFPQALALYQESARLAERGLPQMLCQQRYHSGTVAFLLNDWAPGRADLEYFLLHTTGKQFRPYAAFMVLFARWMLGERDTASLGQLARDAVSWVRPNQSFDAYARRRCQDFLDAGCAFSPIQEIILSATALHEARAFKKALKLLDTAIPLLTAEKQEQEAAGAPPNRDWFGLFYYLKGSCLRGRKKNERARQFLLQAIEQEPNLKHERHSVPYAWVDLAEMADEEGNEEEAQKHWQKAKSYSNYDWEKLLNSRVASKMEISKRRRRKNKRK